MSGSKSDVSRVRGLPHQGDIKGVVAEFDFVHGGLTRRDALSPARFSPLGHINQHLEPLGALGMSSAGKMVEVMMVGDQRGLKHG